MNPWQWVIDVLLRANPDDQRRRKHRELDRLESAAGVQVRRANQALAERRRVEAAMRNTAQALQRRQG